MKIKNTVWAVSIMILTFVLSSCTMYKEVTIKDITQVKVINASANSINLEVLAVIDNPNFYDVQIQSGDLKVMLEDSSLGTVNFEDIIIIPGGSQNPHSFPVVLKPEGILSGAVAVFEIMSKNKVKVRIKGTVNVKAMFIDRVVEINTENDVDFSK